MDKTRPKISVYIATSLDGYIAGPNGELDWLNIVHSPDEDYGFQIFFSSIDAIVLGRKTYETVCSFSDWPYKEKRVFVLSNSLETVNNECELFRGEISDLVSKLHREGLEHVWVDGGVTISHFLQHKLVDQITLTIFPILLGSGIRLFHQLPQMQCHLISSEAYPSGLVQQNYEILQ